MVRKSPDNRSMIQWNCGFKPHDEISIDLLCARLGIQEVTADLSSKRLRWYGHVVRSSSYIKSVTNMEVPCSRARGRPRKTWSDCVRADMNVCSLGGIDPQNQTAWRSGIRSISHLLPTPATGTPTADEKLNQDQVKSSPIGAFSNSILQHYAIICPKTYDICVFLFVLLLGKRCFKTLFSWNTDLSIFSYSCKKY